MTTINNSQLIEKVGGIEKAIALEAMLQKHAVPESWKISIINGMWHRSSVGFTHSDLRTVIAKHDEFKVGDLVIDSTGFFDWLCKVDYLSSDGRVVMYKHDKSKNDTAYQTWPNIETVRHATPSEIKAGHRIDDNTDNCSDIRNHVSPSTKVVDL